VIVEVAPEPEPVEEPPAKVRARSQAPPRERPVREPPPPPEPPSPRTAFRLASEHMALLQQEREQARRSYWQDAIAKSLR